MSSINVGRVILGGLAAGVVLNIGEFLLNGVLLAKDMEEEFKRLTIAPPGTNFFITATVITFILGIVMIYLYAAIRPRFGPGVKTAICAGLIAWFFVYLYVGMLYSALGMISVGPTIKGIVWGIFEYGLAAIVGAWVYQES